MRDLLTEQWGGTRSVLSGETVGPAQGLLRGMGVEVRRATMTGLKNEWAAGSPRTPASAGESTVDTKAMTI